MKNDRSGWPAVLVIYQLGYHDPMVELLALVLATFRLQVVGATNETEVRQQLLSARVRLAIVAGWGTSDLNLPTGKLSALANRHARSFDGPGLGIFVRNQPAHIPVILTSGYCLPDAMLNQIDRLGLGFLPKPFSQEELAEILLLLLWRGGTAARKADEFFSSGRMKQIIGDIKGAAEDFTRALALRPSDAECLNHRSEVRRALGDAAGAITDADAAIRFDPTVAGFYFNRGLALGLDRNDAAAETAFTQSLRLLPQPHVYLCRSISREHLGNLASAVADMNAAEQVLRPASDFYERRAKLKEMTGDVEGALVDYEQAERLRAV